MAITIEGKFTCMNPLCGKFYRRRAQPFVHQCTVPDCPDDGMLLGHLMAHTCPFCDSIYTRWLDPPK